MIARFSLTVEVEADSPSHAIGLALSTIEQEKRWAIRVTGILYPSVREESPDATRLMAEYLDVAKKQLRNLNEDEDWKGGEGEP